MNYTDSDWSESKEAPSGPFRQLRKPTEFILLFPPSTNDLLAQPPTLFLATVGLSVKCLEKHFQGHLPRVAPFTLPPPRVES